MSEGRPQLDGSQPPSAYEAKLDLLGWAEQADQELHAQVHGWIEKAGKTARKLAPWAAGAAMVSGIFFGRKRKRGADQSSRSPLGPMIGIAAKAAPIVMAFLRTRREGR